MWAAMQGLAALDIDWDDGPNANVTTAEHRQANGYGVAEATESSPAKKATSPRR